MTLLADTSPDFSAFTICILDKCLTLITAESGAFSVSEKSMVSLYMCNTLKYLLETQVISVLTFMYFFFFAI